MDFEEELRKFARSDMPLRQMRESVHWPIELWIGDACLSGEVQDVSRGGIGAVVYPDSIWQKRLVIGCELLLSFLWDEADAEHIGRVSARVTWLRKHEDKWDVGLNFFDLNDDANLYIERYLLARIVTRHLDDDGKS
ncbi:MAG: hypothetical protein ACI8V2_003537 [Candidatus Latescibacterota bacterium]|jgi:hypothetical protein